MQDAFAYCTELVRTADRDRFLASLFASAAQRYGLHALYAFNVEVSRVREVAREPLPGELRLQWWSEVVDGGRREEARANPVAQALLATIERHHLNAATLADLIEAHRFDLYDDPMATLADLEIYVAQTTGAIMALAVQILSGATVNEVTAPAGLAQAIVGVEQAFPLHTARRQLYVPGELLERHGVKAADLFAGRSSTGLQAALAELRAVARRLLAGVRDHLTRLPSAALPALLPVALVRPSLDRLDRDDPFTPSELPSWLRQWLIWRAARNPKRIAS